MSVLVLGVAGGLGRHAALALLARGDRVLGLDLPRPGADPAEAEERLRRVVGHERFALLRGGTGGDDGLFPDGWAERDGASVRAVLDLAAPPAPGGPCGASVRLTRQLALLDLCLGRFPALEQLVQVLPADPSGGDPRLAGAEERLGRAYARAHGLRQTGLRLTEVYGPWGEPAGACRRFADALAAGRPVFLPEPGRPARLLWVEDAAAGIVAALDRPPTGPDPYRRLDLAGPEPVKPERLLALLEDALRRRAERRAAPVSVGPPEQPALDPGPAGDAIGWRPATGVEDGIARFAAWHRGRRAAA